MAGLLGHVCGLTTPSITGVTVVGELSSDYALYVRFAELNEGFWFAPGLLEFVDHAPGSEIRLAGVPKVWRRTADGGWVEQVHEPQN